MYGVAAFSTQAVELRRRRRFGATCCVVFQLAALLFPMGATAQVLISFAGSHVDPGYVGKHIDWIETRPFDGIVINEYLGRNVLNTRVKEDTPSSVNAGTGAITYEAASRSLSPVAGAFKKFSYNFVKVNFDMVALPPLLTDESGWKIVYESSENYAKAAHGAGLKGIFFDNETYVRPPSRSGGKRLDYWLYRDQAALAEGAIPTPPFPAALELARRRGRELMRAFVRGYPGITVIVAHGPSEGCGSWKAASGHFADDEYLLGAFTAGMVEGRSGEAVLVDGGEDYDLKSASDFAAARAFRKGTAGPGKSSITSLGPGRCPFMDAGLAKDWSQNVSVAFSTFDKERPSLATSNWTPIGDVAAFQRTLTNALRATDKYVWHYSQWQDWWGDTTEEALKPWIRAIQDARKDAKVGANSRPP